MSSDEVIDGAPVDEPNAKKKSSRKLVIAGAVVALGMVAGAGGVWWYSRSSGGDHAAPAKEEHAEAPAAEEDPSASYIEVPAIEVNLRGAGTAAKFLKVRFVVVAAAGKTEAVKGRLPVVLDALQPFLRELRPDDLAGSAAVFRIKEEIMRRSSEALGPGMVRDVLIQELVQQ